MILNLPADTYASESVASVSGLSGSDRGEYVPIVATAAIFLLVRNNDATRRDRYNRDLSREEAIA